MAKVELNDWYEKQYPDHDRTSCSDEHPINADVTGHGCHRCNAILFQQHEDLAKQLATTQERIAELEYSNDVLEVEKDLIKDQLSAQQSDNKMFVDMYANARDEIAGLQALILKKDDAMMEALPHCSGVIPVGTFLRIKQALSLASQTDALIQFEQSINLKFCDEINRMKRQIEELREKKFARFNNEECWIFQGDEHDRLESLTCPVVISPGVLAPYLRCVDALEKISAIENEEFGGDWDEIEEARTIADVALTSIKGIK